MNILLNMPTAAKVMQDATVHKVRRFLSLGNTQSMLYSFFTAIVRISCDGGTLRHTHRGRIYLYFRFRRSVFLDDSRVAVRTIVRSKG